MSWPSIVRWWQERHDAKRRNREAAEELRVSLELLRRDREELVQPLLHEHRRNKFSDMIRDALAMGYDTAEKGGS